jgi:hypothetical protein
MTKLGIIAVKKESKHLSLAPIAVKILFIFSLKIKRLQRIAGLMTPEKA